MKKYLIFLVLLFHPNLSFAAPATPADLDLTPSDTAIKVTWTANTDTPTGYYLYWDTVEGDLSIRKTISDPSAESYTITGLSANTTYYVAISAFDDIDESTWSKMSTKTLNDDAPNTPSGFGITSLNEITFSDVGLKWTLNAEGDIDFYKIYYGTTSGSYPTTEATSEEDINSYTVTGLSASTRYYFAISAVDLSGNGSVKSSELIVDTLTDTNPPNVPGTPSAVLSDTGEVTIAFAGNNAGMVDLTGYKLHYGTASGSYDTTVDIGAATSYILPGLPTGATYYLAVSSYDYTGNESTNSAEGSILIEEFETFLSDADIKEGCFIATAVFGSYDHPAVKIFREFRDGYLLTNSIGKKVVDFYYTYGPGVAKTVKQHHILRAICLTVLMPLLILSFLLIKLGLLLTLLLFVSPFLIWRWRFSGLVLFFLILFVGISSAEENNTMGLKGGYFLPTNKLQRDVYENQVPVTIFYDRLISSRLSVEIGGGYIEKTGKALTSSGDSTNIEAKLLLAPFSGSIKWNMEITPLIKTYIGIGGDYWYYKEETGEAKYKGEVGGYHGKAGINFFKVPHSFDSKMEENFSFIIEVVYSKIDRFGQNKTDLGGWFFNVGVGYSF